jgi:hypothetical protein
MMHKKILRPDRLRQVPAQFSWIDHRLVRDNFLRHGDPAAWSLYLVLVTVADAQGLSYYSDATLGRLLKLDPVALSRARQQLHAADLLAYQKPFTQVLSLPTPTAGNTEADRAGVARSVGEILRQALHGGTHD